MKIWIFSATLALLHCLTAVTISPVFAQSPENQLPEASKIELPRDIKWTSGLNQQQPMNPALPAANKIVLPRDIKWTSGLILPGADGPTVPANPPAGIGPDFGNPAPDARGGFGVGSNANMQGGFGVGSNANMQGGFGLGSNANMQGGFGVGSNSNMQGGFGGSNLNMQGGFGVGSNTNTQGGFGRSSNIASPNAPNPRWQSNVDASGRAQFTGNSRQLTNPETGTSTFSGFGQQPYTQVPSQQP